MKDIKLNINIDVLKIFALVTMTIDHVGKYLLENGVLKECMFAVGRTSFPIFSFLLMMHLAKMDIYKKYIIRLLGFGLLSLVVVALFQSLGCDVNIFSLNILLSFLLGVVFLKICDLIKKEEGPKLLKAIMLGFSFCVFTFLSLAFEYKFFGFLFLVFLYLYFKKKNNIILGIVLLLSCLINFSEYWVISFFTMVVLFFNQYDVKHKRIINKWWFFYAYYPLHLFIIFCFKFFIAN